MGTAIIDITKQGSEGVASEERSETASGPSARSIGSPVSNAAYNLIAALHVKLEGLKAYREYANDADAELWEELRRAELDTIYKLVSQLEQTMKEGSFFEVPDGPH